MYFTNQTADRHKAREIEVKIEKATGLILDNPFYEHDGTPTKEIKVMDAGEKPDMSDAEIVAADLKKIKEADALLAYFSIDRNIGSAMEVAIASFAWGKPVFVIADLPNALNHPWIKYFANQVFATPYEFIQWYLKTHPKEKPKRKKNIVQEWLKW